MCIYLFTVTSNEHLLINGLACPMSDRQVKFSCFLGCQWLLTMVAKRFQVSRLYLGTFARVQPIRFHG